MVSEECVGVAWIKYLKCSEPGCVNPPTVRRMSDAFSVASQAGLVLEVVERQIEGADRKQLRAISEKLKPFSASCTLDFGKLPLDGYIIHRPFHAHACGDFHMTSIVDNTVIGLLLGDGTGKAVTGLLNALPLITCFEVFGKSSGSTRHVIDRLRAVSRKLGLSGTAVYFTFTLIGKELWLAMTSAGHEIPILVRPKDGVSNLPKDPDSPAFGKPLGLDIDSPQGEHLEKLLPGDVIVVYTDGVSDAFATDEDETADLARNKIMSIALSEGHRSCKELAEAIVFAAEKANALLDDATVCVIRRRNA